MTLDDDQLPAAVAGSSEMRTRDRRYLAMTIAIVASLYLLLWNPYWSAGPDTPFYISVARNLAVKHLSLKQGYFFNGNFVARVPPGWPMALALAMRVSASFLFLNLLPLALMVISAGVWYRILRRFASPGRSSIIVLLSALLYNWYSASNQLRSEALFCAAFSAAALVAFQISEGGRHWWRIALLTLLCAAMVEVRYAGLPALALIVAVLLSGRLSWRFNGQWAALLLSVAVAIGAFLATRDMLQKRLAPPPPPAPKAGAQPVPRPREAMSQNGEEPAMVAVGSTRDLGRYVRQGLLAGQWIAGLLWEPAHIGVTSPALGLAANALGWIVVSFYAVALARFAMRRQWLLIGVSLYSMAVIMRWSTPNPRYLMPTAPAVILGIWLGMESVRDIARRPWARPLAAACIPLFLLSLLICNLTLFGIDAWIARSPRYYALYNGGETEQLLSCAAYLGKLGAADGEIAVSQNYWNLNRVRPNGLGLRGLAMLTNRGIDVVPTDDHAPKKKKGDRRKRSDEEKKLADLLARIGDGEPGPAVAEYAALHAPRLRYYVYRPPVSPWRAWHFRVGWLQRRITGQEPVENPGWELYEIRDGDLIRIGFPRVEGWPTRVSGL